MPRRGRPLNQPRQPRAVRRRLLIVTEGVKTEVQYFEGLAQYLKASGAAVRGVKAKGVGKDPRRVLQAAIDVNGADPDGYDAIWVVVDVDEHATLDEALTEGKRLEIPVVVSNPCFEVWLLWHYEDYSAHIETEKAVARLTKHKHTDKRLPNEFPFGSHDEAVRRAGKSVDVWSKGGNPSSGMPHLVDALRG